MAELHHLHLDVPKLARSVFGELRAAFEAVVARQAAAGGD